MKSVFFPLLLFISTSIAAQINKGAFDDYIYFINQNRPTYEGVEGTPYLSESFTPAMIDNFKDVVYIKFNAFADNIEFKKPDDDVAILSMEKDYRFKLLDGQNTQYEIHDYINAKGATKRTFFKKIGGGEDFTLFLKHNVKYTPKKMATSGFEQNQPAKFTKIRDTYYIGQPKEDYTNLVAIPSRKKEISTFFDKKSKTMLQFIKKEKLKLDNEDDLVKIFKFYWSED
ncbi:hypothetical protein FGM00_01700 [Aggregatimonas sangjinii]|uniref:GLPGLI family protein n=1 Tax=Aggregatimonas sangjinii TaxID=2583587 RepID=A0A5B7SKB0_9FLAO|nr:hypothetical protein [Aggregatimonas sangjinii]QCW98896.1 hypothetical protein FGM00_01700 [Aggregatimonas sangjinii]